MLNSPVFLRISLCGIFARLTRFLPSASLNEAYRERVSVLARRAIARRATAEVLNDERSSALSTGGDVNSIAPQRDLKATPQGNPEGAKVRDSAARRPYLRQFGERVVQARLCGLGFQATLGGKSIRNRVAEVSGVIGSRTTGRRPPKSRSSSASKST